MNIIQQFFHNRKMANIEKQFQKKIQLATSKVPKTEDKNINREIVWLSYAGTLKQELYHYTGGDVPHFIEERLNKYERELGI